MDTHILWKVNTSLHDWNDGHFMHDFLKQATTIHLLGPVTWRKLGIHGTSQELLLEHATDLLDKLPTPLPDEPPHSYLEAGGEQPWPWSVKISIAPFDEKEKKPRSMSSVWLFFSREAISTVARSQELFQAFCTIHTPENTEYALIHPYQHWLDFANQYYKLPVTIGPMFKGVFWANFLGPGHLNEFDLQKLSAIPASMLTWIGDKGLFLRVTENILDADTPTTTAKYIQLTKIFHDALNKDT
jgi:hypothetical protein